MLTKIDCETDGTLKQCADPYVEISVRKVIPHEDYRRRSLKNDIALIRLTQRIRFTGNLAVSL